MQLGKFLKREFENHYIKRLKNREMLCVDAAIMDRLKFDKRAYIIVKIYIYSRSLVLSFLSCYLLSSLGWDVLSRTR
jgi:hypothetical protein